MDSNPTADSKPSADDTLASLTHQPRTVLDRIQHLLHRYPVISPAFVLFGSAIVFTIMGNGRFQRPETIGIILQQTAVMATLAVGQTLIILTAGIDLAVGTGMLLTHLVIAKLVADQGVAPILALLIGALVGLGLGAFHGFVVTKVRLPPFIVTLGTFYIFNSIGLVYSKAQTTSKEALGGQKSLLLFTGRQISLGSMRITWGVIIALGLYILVAYVLANTSWGLHVYATGDDPEAARLAGINVNRVLFSVYVVAGLIYALGGWVQLGRSLSASSNAATDVNLETITAVVIGGTSLFGGRGRIWGTLVGALIVTVFRIGLKLGGVDAYYQNFAIGSLILIAVALDQWIRRVGR
ncbi:MAG: ABC transporter permease [Acidimicrobiia bacterium]